MICSQCHASSALQPSFVGLQPTDALSADGSCQTWLHARGFVKIFRNVAVTSPVPVGLRNHYFLHTFNHE